MKAWALWRQLDFSKAARSEFGGKGLPQLLTLVHELHGKLEVIAEVQVQLGSKTLNDIQKSLMDLVGSIHNLAGLDEAQFFSNKARIFQDIQNQYDAILEHYPNALTLFRALRPEREADEQENRLKEVIAQAEHEREKQRAALEQLVNQLNEANAVKRAA